MTHGKTVPAPCEEYGRILNILETQLTALDRAGAHKAAAHLDAAIQQLRRDEVVLQVTSAGTAPSSTDNAESSISEELTQLQVFARKAKPARSG